jgi:phospholipase C
VCSQIFDHTSCLRFLERFTGVKEPNISDWRRSTFGDLTSAFRFDEAAAQPPELPDTSGTLALADYAALRLPLPVLPTTEQQAPRQEKGARKRVAKRS